MVGDGKNCWKPWVIHEFSTCQNPSNFGGFVRPKRMVGMVGSDVGTMVALWKIMG